MQSPKEMPKGQLPEMLGWARVTNNLREGCISDTCLNVQGKVNETTLSEAWRVQVWTSPLRLLSSVAAPWWGPELQELGQVLPPSFACMGWAWLYMLMRT